MSSKPKKDDVAAALAARRAAPPPNLSMGQGVKLSIDEESPAQTPLTSLREGEHIIYVEIDRLLSNPYQPRRKMDEQELLGLMYAIKKNGFTDVLATRLNPKNRNQYQLSAGHRRREALRRLLDGSLETVAGSPFLSELIESIRQMLDDDPTIKGLIGNRVPIVVRDYSDREMMDIAWQENTRRSALTPPEEGGLFLLRREADTLTQEQLARELGVEVTYVKRREAAARDPEDIQAVWVKEDSMRAITYLRQLKTKAYRAPIIQDYLEGKLIADQVRDAVALVKEADAALARGEPFPSEGAREHLAPAEGSGDSHEVSSTGDDLPSSASRESAQANASPLGSVRATFSSNGHVTEEMTAPATQVQHTALADEGATGNASDDDRAQRIRAAKLHTALRTLISYHRDLLSSGEEVSPQELKTRTALEKILDDIRRAHEPA